MDPKVTELIGGVVRAVVAAVGGLLINRGITVPEDELAAWAGAITVLVVAVWSVARKLRTPR